MASVSGVGVDLTNTTDIKITWDFLEDAKFDDLSGLLPWAVKHYDGYVGYGARCGIVWVFIAKKPLTPGRCTLALQQSQDENLKNFIKDIRENDEHFELPIFEKRFDWFLNVQPFDAKNPQRNDWGQLVDEWLSWKYEQPDDQLPQR